MKKPLPPPPPMRRVRDEGHLVAVGGCITAVVLGIFIILLMRAFH